LSTDWPEVFPQLTTFLANSTVGTLMTQSPVARNISNVWFWLLITQPTIGGWNSIIVCHDRVMMFARPVRAVVTSTTGPGSSNPFTCARGNALFFAPAISQFSFEGAVEDGGVVLGLLQSRSSAFFVRFCLNDRKREVSGVPENIISAFAGSTHGPAALNDNASVRENGLLSD
jgi:hypothetical protein